MEQHKQTRDQWGNGKANLVWGQAPDGTMAHISIVKRGLACDCICPGMCGSRLVAKTNAATPHFAHHQLDACGGGPETALHKLAKQIVEEHLRLVVPRRVATHGTVETVLSEAIEVALSSARREATEFNTIVPDLYVTAKDRELLVEILVTHTCGDEKIHRIRERGIATVEIDLSMIPRNAAPDAIADAVIRSAPRTWLFNQAIDDAVATLRQTADDARVAADNKLKADALRMASDYARAQRTPTESPAITTINVLRGIGLDMHTGVEVAGSACFTTGSAYWQAVILADVLYGQGLEYSRATAVGVSKHLEGKGLIRPEFKFITKELEAATTGLDNRFVAPWRAIESYLKYLTRAGIVVEMTHGFALSQRVSSEWFDWINEEIGRVARRENVLETIQWILDQVPAEDRGDFTVNSWLGSIDAETAETYADCLNGMETLQRIDGELRAISGLFRGSRTDVKDRLGLPIAAECERRLLAIAAAKAQRKADAARRAEQVKRDRQKEVADHAAKVFSRELLESWLNTPLLDLENRSPHDAAYAGFHGAAKARDIIFAIERQKQSEDAREGEATFWRDKLRKTVGLRLRDDEAEAFLNDRDEDYKRAKAVVFCRDKRTYNVVIRKLDAWTNAFGSGRGV